jgi:hypothetical protein
MQPMLAPSRIPPTAAPRRKCLRCGRCEVVPIVRGYPEAIALHVARDLGGVVGLCTPAPGVPNELCRACGASHIREGRTRRLLTAGAQSRQGELVFAPAANRWDARGT